MRPHPAPPSPRDGQLFTECAIRREWPSRHAVGSGACRWFRASDQPAERQESFKGKPDCSLCSSRAADLNTHEVIGPTRPKEATQLRASVALFAEFEKACHIGFLGLNR